jgi:hypothetical protein
VNRPTLRPLPPTSLLSDYAAQGAYTDCYTVDVAVAVSAEHFIAAFYTSRLFKVERFVLKWLVSKPSADAQALALAVGARDTFAAWTLEGRSKDQLLMCDYQGRTRSWLMVTPNGDDTKASTRLSFGTAVVANKNRKNGAPSMPFVFRLLLGFHRLYAQALLRSAVNRLDLGEHISNDTSH